MSSADPSRSGGRSDRDWKRDAPLRTSPGGPSSSQESPSGGASLRSRISEKEAPRSAPQGPAGYRDGPAASDRGKSSPEGPSSKDDRDSGRKRASSGTISQALCESGRTDGAAAERDADPPAGNGNKSSAPQKRLKIDRSRYLGAPGGTLNTRDIDKVLHEAGKGSRGGGGRGRKG